jgi:hypothetical protein
MGLFYYLVVMLSVANVLHIIVQYSDRASFGGEERAGSNFQRMRNTNKYKGQIGQNVLC